MWGPIDSKNEIRLLTIKAASKERAPLEVDLTVRQHDSTAPYEALSYTWGNPRNQESIRCNGRDFAVTKNCADALRALRRRATAAAQDSSAVPIWIDAICINQADLEERNAQVARMAEIFGNARRTVIYLGEPDGHWEFLQKHVLHVLRDPDFRARVERTAKEGQIGHRGESNARRQYLSEVGWEEEDLFRTMDKSRFRFKGEPGDAVKSSPKPVLYEQDIKKHWNGFFRRPWFTRAWIVQEVLSSPDLILLLGCGEVPWSYIEDSATAVEFLKSTQPIPASDITPPIYAVPSVVGMRRAWGCLSTSTPAPWRLLNGWEDETPQVEGVGDLSALMRGRGRDPYDANPEIYQPQHQHLTRGLSFSSLRDIMCVALHFKCQDPRDRLFAIVSLFGEALPGELTPNYAKSVVEVYVDIAWFLLCRGNIEALHFETYRERGNDVPTWVIDWESDTPTRRQQAFRTFEGFGRFAAEQKREVEEHNASLVEYEQRHSGLGLQVGREANVLHVRGLDAGPVVPDHNYASLCRWGNGNAYVLGPPQMAGGDHVCILLGCPEPFVLRSVGEGHWKLIGSCHVDGLMLGEVIAEADWRTAQADPPVHPWQDFRII